MKCFVCKKNAELLQKWMFGSLSERETYLPLCMADYKKYHEEDGCEKCPTLEKIGEKLGDWNE